MKIIDLVKKYDPQNQFDVIRNYHLQIENAYSSNVKNINYDKNNFNKIIITGLGGSAISGDLVQNYLKNELDYPLFINRNYELPKFADENTLVIVSSYSGNTEETISAFQDALKKKCKVISISTGGMIMELSNENNVPVIEIQKGFQPRFAICSNFFTLIKIFETIKLIEVQSEFVNSIIDLYKIKSEYFISEDNSAYQTAINILGYIPVIYSVSDYTNSIGNRLKGQFNENAKLHAFHNVYPEMNHNEIVGWENIDPNLFVVLNIMDESYHHQVQRRFEITSSIIRNKVHEILNIESKENDFRIRLLDLVYQVDWISYYTALFRNQDPSTIKNINTLKEQLAKNHG